MRRLLLLLLSIIVIIALSGCEEGARYLASAGSATCLGKVRLVVGYYQNKSNRDRGGAANAFSAWCWLPQCLETMHQIVDDNPELAGFFTHLRDACGQCYPTTDLPYYAPNTVMKEINGYCNDQEQYRGRREIYPT